MLINTLQRYSNSITLNNPSIQQFSMFDLLIIVAFVFQPVLSQDCARNDVVSYFLHVIFIRTRTIHTKTISSVAKMHAKKKENHYCVTSNSTLETIQLKSVCDPVHGDLANVTFLSGIIPDFPKIYKLSRAVAWFFCRYQINRLQKSFIMNSFMGWIF